MNTVILTDQELNEWVVNTFEVPYYNYYGVQINYCNDLNHTHLMEEKIREIKNVKSYPLNTDTPFTNYMDNLKRVLGVWHLFPDEEYKVEPALISASARKRCEAAYLTFN